MNRWIQKETIKKDIYLIDISLILISCCFVYAVFCRLLSFLCMCMPKHFQDVISVKWYTKCKKPFIINTQWLKEIWGLGNLCTINAWQYTVTQVFRQHMLQFIRLLKRRPCLFLQDSAKPHCLCSNMVQY